MTDVPYYLNKTPHIDGEVWRDIPLNGFDKFQVSSLGRVRHLHNDKYYIKHQGIEKGYCYMTMTLPGQDHNTKWRTHRLVSLAFTDVPDTEPDVPHSARDGVPFQINHKLGNKTDNRASSIEWATAHENVNHAVLNNLYKTNINVRIIDKHNDTVYDFCSLTQAANFLNIPMSRLQKINSGVIKDVEFSDRYNVELLHRDDQEDNLNTAVELMAIDCIQQSITIYKSINLAEDATKVSRTIIANRLRNKDLRLTAGYIFTAIPDPETLQEYPKYSIQEAIKSKEHYLNSIDANTRADLARPIEVYDVNTKTSREFVGLRNAVKFYGDDEGYIRRVTALDRGLSILDGRVYRWVGNDAPWETATEYKPVESYQARNYLNGEITRFERASEVRELFGDIPFNILGKQTKSLKPGQTCRPIKGWFLKSEDREDCSTWPEFTEQEVQDSLTHKQSPSFLAKNYLTGEIRFLESAKDVRELFKRSPTDTMKYCYHPRFPVRTIEGWLLKKEDDDTSWPYLGV